MRRRRKTNRRVVVLLSDTHAGHKLGLCDPDVVLTDAHSEPYSPALTKTQRYLWELYTKHIAAVAELADGYPVDVIHNGDLTHGNAYADHLVSTKTADQFTIARHNLSHWFENRDINLSRFRIVAGTAAHGFGAGTTATVVSEMLQGQYPKADIRAVYHLVYTVPGQNGQRIDASHHGPFPGSRAWLEGNTVRYYLRSAMEDELHDGEIPPRVYARAHYHTYIAPERVSLRWQGGFVTSELVILPSYCGIDDYVRRATRSKRKIDLGMVALVFGGGLRDIVPFVERLDVRTHE